MKKLAFTSGLFVLAVAATMSSARAAPWPASVIGSWDVRANQSHLVLRISNQGVAGVCRVILGQILDLGSGALENVQGFYCPGSGRISFLRKNRINNDSFQTWTGNVSDNGVKLLIGGTFTEYNANVGEYGFAATK